MLSFSSVLPSRTSSLIRWYPYGYIPQSISTQFASVGNAMVNVQTDGMGHGFHTDWVYPLAC